MVCQNSETNGVSDNINIDGNIFVPPDAQNGTVVWDSGNIDSNVFCDAKPYSPDSVYIYPYPNFDASTLPDGLRLQLSINGKVINSKSALADWQKITTKTGVITSKLQIIKTSSSVSNSSNLPDIPLYQVDGGGGLNQNADKSPRSLRVTLLGFSNVKIASCSSNISILNKKNSIGIDNSILEEKKISKDIAKIDISCVPVTSWANKKAYFSIIENGAVNYNGFFGTNKNDLVYSLYVGDTQIKPNATVRDFLVNLDSEGKASLSVIQKMKLLNTSTSNSWLYDKTVVDAISDKANLSLKLTNLE